MEPQIVDQVKLAGSVAAKEMSLIGLYFDQDFFSQAICTFLIIVSVFTWGIIFDKLGKVSRLKSRASYFEEKFWSSTSLDVLFDKIRRPADPMQAVFVAGMKEWRGATERGLLSTTQGRGNVLTRIELILQATIAREMDQVESWMTFLATVSTIAPFLGLFGTVWGVMDSLISIAQVQNPNLSVVAPGIAEALLTTAFGLIAAIPATAAYNKFTTEIARYGARLDNFANDFVASLSRSMEDH